MGITIKGVNTDLLLYKTKLEKRVPCSERLGERAWNLLDKIQASHRRTQRMPFLDLWYSLQTIGYCLCTLEALKMEEKITHKNLSEILSLPPQEIAMNLVELKKASYLNQPAKCYGRDFHYVPDIRDEWLDSLQIIWGDAHLEALEYSQPLSSLTSVWGDLYLSKETDLSDINLEMVYGDIYVGNAIDVTPLTSLLAVGGNIYYHGQVYDLENFQKRIRPIIIQPKSMQKTITKK